MGASFNIYYSSVTLLSIYSWWYNPFMLVKPIWTPYGVPLPVLTYVDLSHGASSSLLFLFVCFDINDSQLLIYQVCNNDKTIFDTNGIWEWIFHLQVVKCFKDTEQSNLGVCTLLVLNPHIIMIRRTELNAYCGNSSIINFHRPWRMSEVHQTFQ